MFSPPSGIYLPIETLLLLASLEDKEIRVLLFFFGREYGFMPMEWHKADSWQKVGRLVGLSSSAASTAARGLLEKGLLVQIPPDASRLNVDSLFIKYEGRAPIVEEAPPKEEPPKTPSEAKQFLQRVWAPAYQRFTNTDYIFSWGRDIKAIKRLLKVMTYDELSRLVGLFFSLARKNKYLRDRPNLSTFIYYINNLRAAIANAGADAGRQCPICGTAMPKVAVMYEGERRIVYKCSKCGRIEDAGDRS